MRHRALCKRNHHRQELCRRSHHSKVLCMHQPAAAAITTGAAATRWACHRRRTAAVAVAAVEWACRRRHTTAATAVAVAAAE